MLVFVKQSIIRMSGTGESERVMVVITRQVRLLVISLAAVYNMPIFYTCCNRNWRQISACFKVTIETGSNLRRKLVLFEV